MGFPEIPVITIKYRGEVSVPTATNVQGGIDTVLSTSTPVLAAGKHRVFQVPATRPHHPTAEHMVYWIDSRKPDTKPNSWHERSWEDAVADSEFMTELENYFRGLQANDPKLSIYSFMGFVAPGTAVDTAFVYDFGLQSQARWHWHATYRIDRNVQHSRILSVDDERDRRRIAGVLNLAGEASIKQFGSQLESFGERLIYKQHIGIAEALEVSRTIFGFSTLETAVSSALSLQSMVKQDWLEHAYQLAGETTSLSHVLLSHMQSYVPNMTIILPSLADRETGNVNSQNQFWVVPFSISGAQSMLAPGGAYLLPSP